MAPSRTKTMKNKHAAPRGGSTKGGTSGGGAVGGRRSDTDGISKPKKSSKGSGGGSASKQVKDKSVSSLFKKKKQKVYSEKELGIPSLNMVTPVGVEKPKGKKKGKIFVDDQDSMNTILSIVQAEKSGQIESKMIKARQMEEIREARRVEADKKEEEKKSRLEDVKDSLRRKRNKKEKKAADADEDTVRVKDLIAAGSKAKKKASSSASFKKKKVSFA